MRLSDDDFYNLFWLLWLQGKWQIRSFWIIDGAILSFILKLYAYVPVTVIYKCNLGWKLYLLESRQILFTLASLKRCLRLLHNYIQKIRRMLHYGKMRLHTSTCMLKCDHNEEQEMFDRDNDPINLLFQTNFIFRIIISKCNLGRIIVANSCLLSALAVLLNFGPFNDLMINKFDNRD